MLRVSDAIVKPASVHARTTAMTPEVVEQASYAIRALNPITRTPTGEGSRNVREPPFHSERNGNKRGERERNPDALVSFEQTTALREAEEIQKQLAVNASPYCTTAASTQNAIERKKRKSRKSLARKSLARKKAVRKNGAREGRKRRRGCKGISNRGGVLCAKQQETMARTITICRQKKDLRRTIGGEGGAKKKMKIEIREQRRTRVEQYSRQRTTTRSDDTLLIQPIKRYREERVRKEAFVRSASATDVRACQCASRGLARHK